MPLNESSEKINGFHAVRLMNIKWKDREWLIENKRAPARHFYRAIPLTRNGTMKHYM
jgi:hypothetical protein